MMGNRIDVVIPAYNAEKTIVKCLRALSKQTIPRKDYRIIVVDDGSNDRTKELALEYTDKLITQENSGPAIARNRGAKDGKGDIIIFTDSDCEPQNNFLREMTRPFEDIEVVGVQGAYLSRQKSIIARFGQIEIEERYKLLRRKDRIDFIGTYAAAYRREEFISANGFDATFPIASGEDTDLSYRLAESGSKLVFSEGAKVYHLHPERLLHYLKVKFFRAYWRNLLYRKNPKKIAKDNYTPQVLKMQVILQGLGILSVAFLALTPLIGISAVLPTCLYIVLFLLTSIPLSLFAFSRDPFVGVLTPLLSWLRATALFLGLFAGLRIFLRGEPT